MSKAIFRLAITEILLYLKVQVVAVSPFHTTVILGCRSRFSVKEIMCVLIKNDA